MKNKGPKYKDKDVSNLNLNQDITNLIGYINDTKPYHTKVNDINIEYRHSDSVNVSVTDAHSLHSELTSMWEMRELSNGETNHFRIPASVFPRFSLNEQTGNKARWTFRGILDEEPSQKGAYRIPYNNGVDVKVNGQLMTKNTHYTIHHPDNSLVHFREGFHPKAGDVITCNLYAIDRVFISINGDWLNLSVEGYDKKNESFDPLFDSWNTCGLDILQLEDRPLAEGPCDIIINKHQRFYYGGGSRFQGLKPGQEIGKVVVGVNDFGNEYYYFEFTPRFFKNHISLGTEIIIKVEQSETYNNIARTIISEDITFKDHFRYGETTSVNIDENRPGASSHNWLTMTHSYKDYIDNINISDQVKDLFVSINSRENITPEINERHLFKVEASYKDINTNILYENINNPLDMWSLGYLPLDYQDKLFNSINPIQRDATNDSADIGVADNVSFTFKDH